MAISKTQLRQMRNESLAVRSWVGRFVDKDLPGIQFLADSVTALVQHVEDLQEEIRVLKRKGSK